MKNLVKITEKEFDVILDLRYATHNNVCSRKLYTHPFCYLHEATIEPLRRVIESAKNLGFKIKIYDAFRPIEVQKYMFDMFPGGFVSNPENGNIPHCRGVAIDLTLCDLNGKELDMGSDFDEFSDIAYHNNYKISTEAQRNRFILLGIMTSAGWSFLSKEWWHYQLPKPRDYEVAIASPDMIAI